jgi:hypothetical protein
MSMDHSDPIVLLFRLVVVLALVLWIAHRFRGGRPPTPMHPSPADDAVLLLKRRRRRVQWRDLRFLSPVLKPPEVGRSAREDSSDSYLHKPSMASRALRHPAKLSGHLSKKIYRWAIRCRALTI